jgi:hypothetical protein
MAVTDNPQRFCGWVMAMLRQLGESPLVVDNNSTDQEKRIVCQFCVTIGAELRLVVREWAQLIFSGKCELDPADEKACTETLCQLLNFTSRLESVLTILSRDNHGHWRWNDLQSQRQALAHLVKHWVTPQKAVGPAARVVHDGATALEIRTNLAKLDT